MNNELLLHTEYNHDYFMYDACGQSYDTEIEDCKPDAMEVLQAEFDHSLVLFASLAL